MPRKRQFSNRRLLAEKLEDRRLLASASAPAILQWFESSFDTIERRTPDIFDAGYGAVWLPPPGRADSGNFSVGYDPYDRFDLGGPDRPTLYGTRTGLETIAGSFDNAGLSLQVDVILNHAGFTDASTSGFLESGGYPGLAVRLPEAIDGDFHSPFESGDLRGRLAGLVDIDHTTNHVYVRHPVDPADPQNLPAGVTPWNGRLANVPTSDNLRFYPDRDASPDLFFDPTTGEMGIPRYPFAESDRGGDGVGDPVAENALGYQLRYLQWMVEVIGVDGMRLDATKHFDPFVLNFFDRAVYRSNPRLLLDGSVDHVFSYGEAFLGDKDELLSYVRKDIDPGDPGRIGGNRDTLDFSAFFAMHDNLGTAGTSNAWFNVRDSLLDLHDDGLHNGSAGVLFVSSHDENGPSELGNVAHAFALMYPGNTVVYMNGKEFGDNRDFPKNGRGDALGGVYGDGLKRLVQIRNTHGRGNFVERWIDGEGLYIFERESSAVVGLSNRGDGGFDQRTIPVAFAPGTHLVELTGNASNSFIDPFDDIPDVVTVKSDGTIDIRVPRNRNASGDFHGSGYVVYGLATPQAPAGLEIIGAASVIPGSVPAANDFDNGITRLSDLHVITGDSLDVRLQTNEVRLLGLESLRDVFADGDNALLRVDGGIDVNGNGMVDFVTPGNVSYGFEFFGDKSSSLVGPLGIAGPRGDGEFLQTIDTTMLSEGTHHVSARAFRHRTDGGPAVFSDFRESIYVDRLPPESAIESFEPWQVGINENRDLIVRSLDKTADSVHVFLDLPAGLPDADILTRVFNGENRARQIDRDQFVFGFGNLSHGNHVATIVSIEPTGNTNIQRMPGLFTSTIFGAGLGDLDLNGTINLLDRSLLVSMVATENQQFSAAGDLNADGWIDATDLRWFDEAYVDRSLGPVDFGDAPASHLRPTFSPRAAEPALITIATPVGAASSVQTSALPTGGIVRDDTADDSLYFRFTATPDAVGDAAATTAGLTLLRDGQPMLTLGSRPGSTAWSFVGIDGAGGIVDGDLRSPDADPGGSFESLVAGRSREFLVRIQYRPGQDDEVTVWMQPDDVLDDAQSVTATTTFLVDASMDAVDVRVGGSVNASWTFADYQLAKQFKPGPAHLIDGPRLGAQVDAESGPQTSVFANGDDAGGIDDEDGISFSSSISPGEAWPVTVHASQAARLDGWIDFNQNGRFEHPAEHIIGGQSIDVVAGSQLLSIAVPTWAAPGVGIARFRISTAGGLTPTSYAGDGEVEDYVVQIVDRPPAVLRVLVASDQWTPTFANHVDPVGQSGVTIPRGADQLRPLPWVGLNRIRIELTEDIASSFVASAFRLVGTTSGVNTLTAVYDAATRIVTLTPATALGNDRYRLIIEDTLVDVSGLALDGDWTNGSTAPRSGNGQAGGRFDFRFNVLPGDGNGNGTVTSSDFVPFAASVGRSVGSPTYSILVDFNGNGTVTSGDLLIFAAFAGQSLPSGDPGDGSPPPMSSRFSGESGGDAWNRLDKTIELLAKDRTRIRRLSSTVN